MLTDLKLVNGEIAFGVSDFELVEDGACVSQDLLERLKTEPGALFYAPDFGAGLLRYLHAPADKSTAAEIKARILSALQSEPRIVPDSWTVSVKPVNGVLEASLSFEAFDSPDPLNLTLRFGEELEVYPNG